VKLQGLSQLLVILLLSHPWPSSADVKIDPRDINPGTVNEFEFGCLDGVTSNIQAQFNAIVVGTASNWAVFVATTNIVPSMSNRFDLGSPSRPFRHLYLGTNSIFMGGFRVLRFDPVTTSLVTVVPLTSSGGQSYVTNPVANQVTSGQTNGWTTSTTWVTAYSNALQQLLYVHPSVSLSGGGSYDYNNTQANVALSWTCNKTMVTRNLSAPVPVGDRARGPGQNGSYTHTGANISVNTTYSITVNDGTESASSSTSLAFYSRRYWGVSATTNCPTGATITGWANELSGSKGVSGKTLSPAGQYVMVAYYSTLGTCTEFSDGSFTYNAVDVGNVVVTNAYGWSGSFKVYRWPNVQTRTLTFTLQ
jgi:hypothetical protein